ncbi:MAG: hypothetical protein ACFFCP_13430 [Promethearchaeota archaeon]
MFRKVSTIFALSIILSFGIISISVQQSHADIADWASLDISGTMTNSSKISMPNAQAQIRMSSGVTVDVSCLFEVTSNETLNASLAFVYPKCWQGFGGEDININFTINVNNTLLNYTILTWENLTSQGYIVNPDDFGGTWIEFADFVRFTFKMQANATYLVSVETRASPLMSYNYGHFSYIVGSATTFSGETHQTVEMFVDDDVGFESFTFSPNQHLIESTNESGKMAVWDFVIDDALNFSSVGIDFTFNEYRRWKPPDPIPTVAAVLAASVLILLVSILVYKRYARV